MAVKTILPTTNLEYSDIRDTLASGGGNVSNNMSSLFKEDAHINIWSKYKPIISDKEFDINDEDLRLAKYGLSPSKVEIDKYTTDSDWIYNLPGEGDPLRLGDFRGYCKDAVHNYILDNPNLYADIDITIPFPEENPDTLNKQYRIPFLDGIGYFSYYLGVAIRFATKNSASDDYEAPLEYYCKTASTTGADFKFNFLYDENDPALYEQLTAASKYYDFRIDVIVFLSDKIYPKWTAFDTSTNTQPKVIPLPKPVGRDFRQYSQINILYKNGLKYSAINADKYEKTYTKADSATTPVIAYFKLVKNQNAGYYESPIGKKFLIRYPLVGYDDPDGQNVAMKDNWTLTASDVITDASDYSIVKVQLDGALTGKDNVGGPTNTPFFVYEYRTTNDVEHVFDITDYQNPPSWKFDGSI